MEELRCLKKKRATRELKNLKMDDKMNRIELISFLRGDPISPHWEFLRNKNRGKHGEVVDIQYLRN